MNTKINLSKFLLGTYFVFQTTITGVAYATERPLIGSDVVQQSNDEVAHERSNNSVRTPALSRDTTESSLNKLNQSNAKVAAAAVACNDNAFIASGSALINQIKTQGFDCVERLFNQVSQAVKDGTFTQNNIITVANEARSQSQSYNGTDPDQYVRSLYYWIRAFYFIKGDPATNATNQAAVESAIKALFNNSNVWTKNEDTGDLVNHAAVDLNNARIGDRFVPQFIDMLNRYDESYQAIKTWGNALAATTWNVLGRCSFDASCRAAQHNSALVLKISNFMHNNIAWLDKPANSYHLHNFGYQLAHLYSGKNDAHFPAMKSTLDAEINRIFNNFGYNKGDTGRRAYMLALDALNYDSACAEFNMCNKKEQIINDVLSDRITCPSGTLFMWAQDMNQAQLEWACNSLGAHENHFHSKMQTNNTPVTPDDNDKLRMIVFNDSVEWSTYGGALFNASTDNGGLYLEGDPSQPGDQATFFAYEEVPARPTFDIWNLRHEYIHYLEGRFITKGKFSDVNGAGRTVWFGEGIAEYISLKECNPGAVTAAGNSTYDASLIFTNEYGVGQDRIYDWGYLTTRYMFEQQNSTFFQMINLFKEGKFQDYRTNMVDNWVSNKTFDSSFDSWLTTVQSTGCTVDNTRPPSPVEPINVDDIQGTDQPGIDACSASAGNAEDPKAGVAQCLVNKSGGARESLAISVPSGLVNVTMEVTLRHGSGTANLKHKHDGWPTDTDYDNQTSGSGTNKTMLVNPVKQGWNYFYVNAEDSYSDVTMLVRYIQNGGTGNNVAPTAQAGGPYSGVVGAGIAFSSNGSTDSDGSISSYSWNFGDGSSSTSANPNHSYANAGTFTATLTVTDDDGATNSDTATVTVTSSGDPVNQLQNGVAKSGLAATTGNDVIYYIDVPSGATNLVIKTSGDGDGDLYTQFNAEPTDNNYKCRPYGGGSTETCTEASPTAGRWYARVKAYQAFTNITLTASYDTSPGGGNVAPAAEAAGPYTGIVGTGIAFNSNGSTDSDGSISSYSWNFGDGSSSTSANPNHSYTAAGTYTATLTVTDNDGATDTDTATVTVTAAGGGNQLQNGVAKSGLAATAGNDVIYYIDVPSGATNLVIKISGDGDADLYTRFDAEPTDNLYKCRPYAGGSAETCTEASPTAGRWYARVKSYQAFTNVTLTASYDTSTGGGNAAPTANAGGPYSGTLGTGIAFTSNASSDSDGSISSYSWNFGDGNVSTSPNPNHSYASTGTFTATLTVTDDDGATDTDTATVTVTASGGSGNQLQNGVAVSGLAATAGNDVVYYIDVPSGATNLVIKISGDGDGDLYTRFNVEPNDNDYKCRPWKGGSTETCTEASPTAGRWYARVKAYNAFTNITLTATYD